MKTDTLIRLLVVVLLWLAFFGCCTYLYIAHPEDGSGIGIAAFVGAVFLLVLSLVIMMTGNDE